MFKELTVVFIITCFIILFVFSLEKYVEKKQKERAIAIDCKLLSRSFKGSTLKMNAIPVVGMGMKGGVNVGTGLATSGHNEEFISSFDCGDHGILISEDKEVFRKAKENNKLTVYFIKNDYKILDIKSI